MEEELRRVEGEELDLDIPEEFRESLGQLSPRTRMEILRDITQQRQVEQMARQWGGASSLDNNEDDEDDDQPHHHHQDDDDDGSATSDNSDRNAFANVMANFNDLFQMLAQGNPGMVAANPNFLTALQNLQEVAAQRHLGLDGDVDTYSYEQLLELEERIGKVNTGVRPSEKHLLARSVFMGGSAEGSEVTEQRCSICLDPYQVGEEITSLPCKHTFHGACIDTWAGENNSCPMCKQAIAQRS
jgi:hypothetical protein